MLTFKTRVSICLLLIFGCVLQVVNTLFFIVILYLMNITLWETMFNILEPGNGGWAAYCFGFAFGYLKVTPAPCVERRAHCSFNN